jgi:hypothetical protein
VISVNESGVSPKVAMEKLAGFESPDAIAKFLVGEGIKGRQGLANVCPVAQYLRRETGQSCMVRVSTYGPGGLGLNYRTPEVVGVFINEFDSSMYPDLDEEFDPEWCEK